MFSHVVIGSNDIERSKRFYNAVLAVLGVREPFESKNATGQTRLFYRHDGNTFGVCEPINGEPATIANGGTIGFKCTSADQVQAFHDTAVAHGGCRSKTRRFYAKVAWVRCIWPMFVIPTGISCVLFIALNN